MPQLALPRTATLDLAAVLGARLLLLSLAGGIFATLFLAAACFTGDYGMVGLSDEAVRTCAHFSVYGSAALLLARALANQHLLAWILSIALSTGEEIRQLWVPSRFGSFDDWCVNVAGITLFLMVSGLLLARRRAC